MKFHNIYFLFLCCLCAAGITYQINKSEETHSPPVRPITFHVQPKENIHLPCNKDPKCALLAEVITFEARGEPLKGQVAVAHVVLNRKNDPRWPNSIKGIVHQPKQFSYLQDKHKQTKPTREDWQQAYHVAQNVLKCVSDVFHKCKGTQWEDPTNKAVFYHTKKVKPHLSTQRIIKTASIGQHVFFKTVE